MSTELLKILFAIGMGQCLLLAVILMLPRAESRLARRGLATFLVVMGLMLWDGYAYLAGSPFDQWRLETFMWVNVSLFGPSLWFYVTGLTRGALPRAYLHLLVTALVLATIGGYRLLGVALPGWIILTIMFGLYAQATVYIVSAIFELLRHKRRAQENLSALSGQSLTWLNALIGTFLVIWALDFAVVFLDFINQTSSALAYQLLLLAESSWVICVGFVALRQPDILHRQLLVEPPRKYRTSGLSDGAAAELKASLEQLMEREKPHLDNELTLPELARRLGITPHLLSQLLNDTMNCNFYEFINQARVREAQAMLRDSEFGGMPILDIAFQAGFNNKNSFNKAFRKHTSVTPSEYRRAQLN